MLLGSGRDGPNQTLGTGADQILPVRLQQSLSDKVVVFGIAILNQRPLHSLLVGVSGDIDPFHCTGVQPGVVHHRGQCGRGGMYLPLRI